MTRVNGREAPKTHGSNGQFDADELAAYGIAPDPEAQHGDAWEPPEVEPAILTPQPTALPNRKAESPAITIVSAADFIQQHPRMRPPVIDGLVRQGETANVVSASKVGKSWFAYGLLLAVVNGLLWLNKFLCTPGRALLIDNELHPETIAHRIQVVAEAMQLDDTWRDSLDILSIRGQSQSLPMLSSVIHNMERGRYAVVVGDAWYRFLPGGVDENSNADVMRLYNLIDDYADYLRAAWVNIHHSSKGDQSGKAITDVGAGAGSQSRAADSHLILRPHEEDGVAVLQAVVRSFPPVEPLALRWSYPLWLPAIDVDPQRIKRPMTSRRNAEKQQQREERSAKELDEGRRAIVQAMTAIGDPETKERIRSTVGGSKEAFRLAWQSLLDDETVRAAGMVRKANRQEYPAFAITDGGLAALLGEESV